MNEDAERSRAGLRVWYGAAVATAVLSGAFCAVILGLLAQNYLRSRLADPLDSQEFRDLKAALRAEPTDELRHAVRARDLDLRREYFRRQALTERGGWLLLPAMVVLVFSSRLAAWCRCRLPQPAPVANGNDLARRAARAARWSVAGLGLCVAGAAMALSAASGVRLAGLPAPAAAGPAATAPAGAPPADLPSDEEYGKQWPRFRGPGGRGVSAYANAPTTWNGGAGRGILWKSPPVPLAGQSSPVVWGERVFLTGATKARREVYCYDLNTGRLLWSCPVSTARSAWSAEDEPMDDTGYAAPTPATDGRRVYASFANGDVAALDFEGKELWTRNFGPYENAYGHATSPATSGGMLILQLDQTSESGDKSRLLGVDGATGKDVWAARRFGIPASWATPIVIDAPAGRQIITCADPWVIAYDPADGKELWKAKVLSGDVAPSPVFGGGLVFAVNTGAYLAAISPDRRGTVTGSAVSWEAEEAPRRRGKLTGPAVRWQAEEGLPDVCSPVTDGKLVWVLTSDGLLTCYDAADGQKVYEQELDTAFAGSPSLAGGRLYLLSQQGVMFIAESGGQYKEIAQAALGEPSLCSPAFLDGKIVIRGKKHLYCVGSP